MLMILTYIFYYIISIATALLCFYFRRFTLADYKNNNSLQKKRRFTIIWAYLVIFSLHADVIGLRKIIIYPVTEPLVVASAYLFAISYIILLGRLEIPKQTHKKKKGFK